MKSDSARLLRVNCKQVLRRPPEPAREIGKVEASTHMEGYRVYQALCFRHWLFEFEGNRKHSLGVYNQGIRESH
jgi:hypothetical protein